LSYDNFKSNIKLIYIPQYHLRNKCNLDNIICNWVHNLHDPQGCFLQNNVLKSVSAT
jgi:hypothetical protein